MKNQAIKISTFLFLTGLLLLVSCKKDDKKMQDEVISNVESGIWRITKFIDSGDDETSSFSGYNFTFNTSGVLNANNGSNNYDGTWSVSDSNSNDDSQDDLHFNISFNESNDFDDLSDDWNFVSQTSAKIELIDVSGGGGGTDYLTFDKN